MSSPLISILIPCYNAEQWIKSAIDSALSQSYPGKEIIVLDDGSTDNSWGIISSFGSRIIAEKTSNNGAGAARNLLLEQSRGSWLQYLDADDYLLSSKISEQVKVLENDPEADVIYSPEIFENRWSGTVTTEYMTIEEPRDPWILLAKWRLPQTGAALWRKQAILDVGGWKEDQPCCQEHELYLRLLKAGKRFRYSPKPGAVYRKWNDDSVCERDKLETYSQRLAITSEAERFLKEAGQLTAERQDEINQARFECARILWNVDRVWANSLMEEIQQTQMPFVPRGRGVPALYRYLYSVLGFSVTEHIAAMRRNIKSRLSFFS